MSLWLPEAEARRQEAVSVIDQVHGALEHFNRELRRIDPYLELVRADPRSTHRMLKPGYYHLVRTPPDSPPTVTIWEGPNGEFREPGSELFEWLRHADLWSDRTRRVREKRQRELKRMAEREKAHETEDRREEMYQRLRSKTRLSVAI